MGIDKITSKILSDAESVAKSVLEQAERESDDILENAKEKADKIVEEAKQKGLSDKEISINRRSSVADIDGRKLILQKKQNLIEETFKKAAEEITSMDQEKYVDFLVGIIKDTGKTHGELVFNKKDFISVGQKVMDKANLTIPESEFTLSQETKDIKGGLLIKSGKIYISGSIDSLFEEIKEEMTAKVADILFNE